MFKLALASILLFSSACGGAEPVNRVGSKQSTKTLDPPLHPTQDFVLAEQAKAGVEDSKLRELLVRHWDATMRNRPVWATNLGDHRFDGQLRAVSMVAIQHRRRESKAFLVEVSNILSGTLGEQDRITASLLQEDLLRTAELQEVCEGELWSLSARSNPISAANVLPDDHKITDLESAQNLLLRYQKIPSIVDDSIANLRRGLAKGKVANARSIQLTIDLVERQLGKETQEWSLYKPVVALKANEKIAEKGREKLSSQLSDLIEHEIKQSFQRYLALLKTELLPVGRKGDAVGLRGLPDGLACYDASIRSHINLDRTADEIHELGLAEIKTINAEMAALGKKLFRTKGLAATVAYLRTSRSLYYTTAEEIVAKAEASLAKAKAAIPEVFGVLPKADCIVVEIPDFEAPYTTIAYYKEPHPNNAKPGEYYINTYQPETRPRFEMEVLAYHESIPGHHLQIAISQEQEALPLFRRYGGSTAFVEGWALYTERLADEMGLYSSDLDRMGMLSYDAWRASRLVVDTGIHAKGWTREAAETFMQEHTALTEGNIKNEVDRYISWPGQAVAYKVGQLEIFRLRAEAKATLGDSFDLRAFHDAVLRQGAVTLPVLAKQIEAWITSKR